MDNKDKKEPLPQPKEVKPIKNPNESTGIYFSSSIKIFDPKSEEIYLQIRGDE